MIEFQKNLNYSDLNAAYGELLTDKQKEFLELYYDCDVSLNEIAEQYGISRQAVRDAIVRGERSLNEFEGKLGFVEKKAKLTKCLSLLREGDSRGAESLLAALVEEE